MKSVYQSVVELFAVSARNSSDPLKGIQETALKKIPVEVIARFETRLLQYGYSIIHREYDRVEYSFLRVPDWNVTVVLGPKKICFRVPKEKPTSFDVRFEIYQTASELCDNGELIAWSVNDKNWLES